MDEKKLARDKKSGAILNTDNEGLKAYKLRKNKMREMNNRVQKLEDDISFIKNLLVEKLGGN